MTSTTTAGSSSMAASRRFRRDAQSAWQMQLLWSLAFGSWPIYRRAGSRGGRTERLHGAESRTPRLPMVICVATIDARQLRHASAGSSAGTDAWPWGRRASARFAPGFWPDIHPVTQRQRCRSCWPRIAARSGLFAGQLCTGVWFWPGSRAALLPAMHNVGFLARYQPV